MTSNNQVQIVKDLPNKKIVVTRSFEASPEDVWRAWTERELLDQWWAPKPWRAETASLNFKEGGSWLYAMVGPDNTKQWVKVDFTRIDPYKSFEAADAFCDEQGIVTNELPGMYWKNEFHAIEQGTKVISEISFENEADLAKIVEMGFEVGFTAALGNLEKYLEANSTSVSKLNL